MAAGRTLYAILGVDPKAGAEEIDAAYARSQQGNEDLSLLRVAYDTLRDPQQREVYDRKLARQASTDAAVVILDEPARSSAFRNFLLLLLALALGGYYWWQSRPVSRPMPPTGQVVAQLPAQAQQDDAEPQVPMQGEIPAAPRADAGAGQRLEQIGSGISVSEVVPVRPTRMPGFDVDYLAWSSFQIASQRSVGSGVMIAPEKILTNCHVLAGGAMGIWVIHSVTRRRAKVEKYSRLEGEDACLLYAPGSGSDVIEWGNSAQLNPGDKVYSLGHPGGSTALVWSDGQFLEHANIRGNAYLKTANYCRPGSSGGPLLDSNGRLVGIVTSGDILTRGERQQVIACNSLTEASARQLLGKSMFPIGLAPAQYNGN